MKRIISYKILKDYNADKLSELINKELKEGWTLAGPLNTLIKTHEIWYIQTMVKYGD